MPRDWEREHGDDRRDRRLPAGRDDLGQADFSTDYAYDPNRRVGYRADEDVSRRADDYGQADYSTDYAYDAEHGRTYRRHPGGDREPPRNDADAVYGRRIDRGDERVGERGRSWSDRAGAFFTGRDESHDARRRGGPSDRVLWAVIVERLEDERGLDLRGVEVLVDDCDVILNGTVRRKDDKRRIEDIADIQGVRNVQNNLRVRDSGRRWF